MAYADDVLITARTTSALAGALQEYEEAAAKLRLRINADKTRNMRSSWQQVRTPENVRLGENANLCRASRLNIWGPLVTERNETFVAIKARLAAENNVPVRIKENIIFQIPF
uniref:Reverse transcriptase domain-containing protein n=1 Tax=Rhodnius prolixus TaxID=13249 RepID=T1HCK1_RHOPR